MGEILSKPSKKTTKPVSRSRPNNNIGADCPSCGANLYITDVSCFECGYNLREAAQYESKSFNVTQARWEWFSDSWRAYDYASSTQLEAAYQNTTLSNIKLSKGFFSGKSGYTVKFSRASDDRTDVKIANIQPGETRHTQQNSNGGLFYEVRRLASPQEIEAIAQQEQKIRENKLEMCLEYCHLTADLPVSVAAQAGTQGPSTDENKEKEKERETNTGLEGEGTSGMPVLRRLPSETHCECSVCLDTLLENTTTGADATVRLKACEHLHYFHHGCLTDWLKHEPRCPVCQVQVEI